jgi:hypothetical protein
VLVRRERHRVPLSLLALQTICRYVATRSVAAGGIRTAADRGGTFCGTAKPWRKLRIYNVLR